MSFTFLAVFVLFWGGWVSEPIARCQRLSEFAGLCSLQAGQRATSPDQLNGREKRKRTLGEVLATLTRAAGTCEVTEPGKQWPSFLPHNKQNPKSKRLGFRV